MKVVLVSPNPADRTLAAGFLRAEGFETVECVSVAEATVHVGAGVSCMVLVEESLEAQALEGFHDAIAMQPPWSDMPLVIIATQGGSLQSLMENLFPISGNVTLLQRPLHPGNPSHTASRGSPAAEGEARPTARRLERRQRHGLDRSAISRACGSGTGCQVPIHRLRPCIAIARGR